MDKYLKSQILKKDTQVIEIETVGLSSRTAEVITCLRLAYHIAVTKLQKRRVPLSEVRKLTKISETEVLDVVNKYPVYFDLVVETTKKTGKKNILIDNVYPSLRKNPQTKEWLEDKTNENLKTIEISLYDNYGYIHGYYIAPSNGAELEYLNTLEKVESIKRLFDLKEASYHLGGFGDSSHHKPKNGWEISREQIEILKKEGWSVLNDKPLTK